MDDPGWLSRNSDCDMTWKRPKNPSRCLVTEVRLLVVRVGENKIGLQEIHVEWLYTGHCACNKVGSEGWLPDTRNSLTLILLMWRIEWTPNSIPLYSYIQQDATLHILFISGNCSTCLGWYFHPSSGEHTIVSTASGICHTVTVICRYRGRVGTGLSVSTIAADSSNGVTNTRCCRYNCMPSWWWVEIPPQTCRAVSRYK
jgi:hypothetical protein